ncbi:MAG: 2-oxo acid dehydrogenase subunit E2 [Armatimonadetes bacterium]|nr:2-oxo acid dehydrogenase subunit E2 [Armatimonadota bacterium]
MAVFEVRVPQMGEGLQDVRILRLIKAAGEPVRKDEPIYEMETDKAVLEVECAVAGLVSRWIVEVNDVVPIGSVIGYVQTEVAEAAPDPSGGAGHPSASEPTSAEVTPAPSRNAAITPRTRAYARSHGMSDEALGDLAMSLGRKVTDADVAAALATSRSVPSEPVQPLRAPYMAVPVPDYQRKLVHRLVQSSRAVQPAVEELPIEWSSVERAHGAAKRAVRDATGCTPTPFTVLAWCVARAVRDFPRFRSVYHNETTLWQYDHLHLGVAVTREDDELLMARIADADALEFAAFAAAMHRAVKHAKAGHDQTTDVMQLSLTNLADTGLRRGVPVVVAPAVATLFVGAPFHEPIPGPDGSVRFRRIANLIMTFDHRVVNGVGAARFLNAVRAKAEGVEAELGLP